MYYNTTNTAVVNFEYKKIINENKGYGCLDCLIVERFLNITNSFSEMDLLTKRKIAVVNVLS